MIDQEEESHAYGVCQSCGGSLRFPLRGTGTSIACPHCDNPTILQLGTDEVIARPVLPPTLPKPKPAPRPKRESITSIICYVVSAILLVVAFMLINIGCNGSVLLTAKGEGSVLHQIYYEMQFGIGWMIFALAFILVALARQLRNRD